MTDVLTQAWSYHPSQSRQVIAEDGTTICRVHRGKKAQRVGPMIAVAPMLLQELIDRLDQTRCGCGDRWCKRCMDDRRTQAVIDEARGVSHAS